MLPLTLKSLIMGATAALILSPILISSSTAARQGQVTLKGAKAAGSSNVWSNTVTIERKTKPDRKPTRPRRKVQPVMAALLTLEWRALKRGTDGSAIEVNPTSVFHTGDRLRLAFKPNQNGYLYIVENTEGTDGTILFPDSRVNNGRNYVVKNQEVILPAGCSSKYIDEKGNCWWQMAPPAGKETFTVILSRDMITDLPNEVTSDGIVVKQQIIDNLKKDSGQILDSTSRPNLTPDQGGGAGRYVTWVTNKNRKDNEELIVLIQITHENLTD